MDTSIPQSQAPGCDEMLSPSTGDFVWFVVYERDPWPEGVKQHPLTSPGGIQYFVNYRSSQSAVDGSVRNIKDPASPYYMGTYSANNGRIKYNIVRRN